MHLDDLIQPVGEGQVSVPWFRGHLGDTDGMEELWRSSLMG
jgi:hypothetical protein